jgi:alanine dehydrogenase
MRAIVRVLDINPKRLAYLSDIFEGRVDLVIPNRARTASYVAESDVVIGAVLVAGAKAPKLVSREMIASMRPGSVVADIAIDQGGCFETSRPTTHSEPTYVEEGVVHYCVANIPGAVARTSTLALTSVTLPYLIRIADEGVEGASSATRTWRKGSRRWVGTSCTGRWPRPTGCSTRTLRRISAGPVRPRRIPRC